MNIITIQDLATDKIYTDTIDNLVKMVNDCNSTTATDYLVVRTLGNDVNFELWLKNRNYQIKTNGQIK